MVQSGFYEETKGIYRLRVPFHQVYTSVFLVVSGQSLFLVDCATTDEDVDGVILPALRKMGYVPCDLSGIVLTHRHSDHAGGLSRLLTYVPDIEIITDLREITNEIRTYPLSGHTEDSIGVLDERSHTLISGDGLQGAGVGPYRCGLKNPALYLETLEKLRGDEGVENVLFSHAYEPWNSDRAMGRERVLFCLNQCKECLKGTRYESYIGK